MVIIGMIVVGAIVLVIVFGSRKSHGALADQSAQVAAVANATSCTDTGYYLQSKLDGSKEVIYDCAIPGSVWNQCVTEQGGIASNATEEVRLLFANALGGQRPSCLH
jgi:hypothetical protein